MQTAKISPGSVYTIYCMQTVKFSKMHPMVPNADDVACIFYWQKNKHMYEFLF